MVNPAFIVEGHMEQSFIKNVCPGVPVRRIGCNGDQVSMMGIAKHLETHIRLLPNNYPIFVIFDRERRVETCDVLKQQLFEELSERDIDVKNLILGIADRTIENWIIADIGAVEDIYSDCTRPSKGEGEFGKSLLKKSLSGVEYYNETTVGVVLLKAVRPSIIRLNSPSFKAFHDQCEIECWWLDR